MAQMLAQRGTRAYHPEEQDTLRRALGDSRCHWEGDTLVSETTNLEAGGRNGSSNNLHLVERFTRVDQDTLQYGRSTVMENAAPTRCLLGELAPFRADITPLEGGSDAARHDWRRCHDAENAMRSPAPRRSDCRDP